MKRVLFLQIKNHSNGGIRFVNKVLSDELVDRDYEVKICSIRKGDTPEVSGSNEKVPLNVINDNDKWEIVHRSDVIKAIKKFKFFRTLIQYFKDNKRLKNDYKKLRDYVRNYDPDYIIASHYQVLAGIPEEYLSRTINVHHTAYKMLEVFKDNRKQLRKYIGKIRYVWLCKSSCEEAIKDGFTDSRYIYNPVKFTSSEKADAVKNKRMVTIARFGEEKRIPLMIEIADEVIKNNKGWKLDIYGVGNDDDIKKKLEEINNKNIQLKGSTNDAKKVLLDSSIYLCTSEFEGFSLSLLEAYECGIPVISFNFGESCKEEIINGKTGFIVEQNKTKDFVKTLDKIIKDKKLLESLSLNSKEFAKQFNAKNVIEKWIELFEEIDK